MDTRQTKKFDAINERLNKLTARRANWESTWQKIAELADPKNAAFTVSRGPGDFDRGGQKTDATLALAAPKWASAIDGLTTPKTQKWHGLTLSDEDLNERFRDYLETVRDILFAARYAAGSNFSNANYENLKTIAFYGSGPFSVTEGPLGEIIYKAWPVQEFYVENNFRGEVDTFFRKFTLNTRQALQEFGAAAPKDVRECDKLDKEWTFLHAVYPNADYDKNRLDGPHKRWASDYLCLNTKSVVEEGGMDVNGFIFARYDVLPNLQDPYGYSPTMLLMPEVKKLMAMGRANLRVGNRAGDPTYLMSDEDIINASRIGQPNAIIPGGVDANGRPRVMPMQGPANVPFTLEMIQDLRQVVREGFDLNLFSVLVNKPDMTATEVLQRAQETATLLSPTTARREKEVLAPVINKELEILDKNGKLPPPPQALAEALQSGQVRLQVSYESPIRRAQEAGDGTAIMRTLEAAAALQQFDPSVKNKINASRTLEALSRVWGAPARIFNSEDEQSAADMQDAQLAQAQQMLAAAPVLSKSAKDMAEAQKAQGSQIR